MMLMFHHFEQPRKTKDPHHTTEKDSNQMLVSNQNFKANLSEKRKYLFLFFSWLSLWRRLRSIKQEFEHDLQCHAMVMPYLSYDLLYIQLYNIMYIDSHWLLNSSYWTSYWYLLYSILWHISAPRPRRPAPQGWGTWCPYLSCAIFGSSPEHRDSKSCLRQAVKFRKKSVKDSERIWKDYVGADLRST